MTDTDIRQVECLVKTWVADSIPVQQQLTPLKQAMAQGDVVYLDNAVGSQSNIYHHDIPETISALLTIIFSLDYF